MQADRFGGILFWLCGILRDRPCILPEIASIKNKDLDRKCKREFYKNHKSEKWVKMQELFAEKCEKAKEYYFENTVQDLKESNPGQWYSKIKRMGGIKDCKTDNFLHTNH